MVEHVCVVCKADLTGCYPSKKYCSRRCKATYFRRNPPASPKEHACRICGVIFPITVGEHNKWLCSDDCRKASVAKCVREFHSRQPHQSFLYRQRTKAKQLPDSNLIRFRRTNPDAPHACESCGDIRVLDIAHKPGHERNGAWRNAKNCVWPEKVWVLCPTCHALIDRMRYPPEELGLAL